MPGSLLVQALSVPIRLHNKTPEDSLDMLLLRNAPSARSYLYSRFSQLCKAKTEQNRANFEQHRKTQQTVLQKKRCRDAPDGPPTPIKAQPIPVRLHPRSKIPRLGLTIQQLLRSGPVSWVPGEHALHQVLRGVGHARPGGALKSVSKLSATALRVWVSESAYENTPVASQTMSISTMTGQQKTDNAFSAEVRLH